MKSTKSISFKNFIFIFILLAAFLLSNAFVRKEIKLFTRKIEEAGEIIKSKKDKIESLFVNVQKLSSEDRIVKLAQDSLQLIRASGEFDKIAVDESQLKQIQKIIDSKYD